MSVASTNKTIGTVIGSAIGKSAAYAAHGAIRAGQGTGRFGADIVAGTTEGFVSKQAELAERRATILASRQTPVAVKVVRRTAKA